MINIPNKAEPIELEVWFISSVDKASYPSGKFGRQLISGQPFKVTNPEEIVVFKTLAKHKDILRIAKKSDIKSVIQNQDDFDSDSFLANRKIADGKIKALNQELSIKSSQIEELNKKIMVLETDNADLSEYKEKYEKMEADLKKLKIALKKKKKAASAANQ